MQYQIQEEKKAHSFQAKIAAHGYRVYKNLAWSNALTRRFCYSENRNKESKKTDPYCCAIKALVDIPPRPKTVEHVPRKI